MRNLDAYGTQMIAVAMPGETRNGETVSFNR